MKKPIAVFYIDEDKDGKVWFGKKSEDISKESAEYLNTLLMVLHSFEYEISFYLRRKDQSFDPYLHIWDPLKFFGSNIDDLKQYPGAANDH